MLFKTPVTFDVSVWELLRAAASPARALVVAEPDGHRDPEYLSGVIRAARRHHRALRAGDAGGLTSRPRPRRSAGAAARAGRRRSGVAGDDRDFRASHPAEIDNTYGPTEAAVTTTFFAARSDNSDTVPIGLPVWNTRTLVLDGRLHPVPAGVAGELYLGGVQLARGYLGRPDLTAERFVADPFATPARACTAPATSSAGTRTAGSSTSGAPTSRSRSAASASNSAKSSRHCFGTKTSDQAIVVPHSDPHTGDHLVGYVVPRPRSTLDRDADLADAAGSLPAYMIPSLLITLAELPLTPNGKVDQNGPARARCSAVKAEYTAPRTESERIVAGIFAEVLGVARVGVDDNFFELGGNSLLGHQARHPHRGRARDTHRHPRRVRRPHRRGPGPATRRARSVHRDRTPDRGGPPRPDPPVTRAAADVVPQPVRNVLAPHTTCPLAVRLTGPLDTRRWPRRSTM